MLRLTKATRNFTQLVNVSRNSYNRCISSTTANMVFNNHVSMRSNQFHSINLRSSTSTMIFYQKNFFSTKKNEEEAEIEAETDGAPENPQDFIHTHLPATVAVPEHMPFLPCLATSRNPVFPRFMKILEVNY